MRERERESVCVCVCEGEREAERERERERERESQIGVMDDCYMTIYLFGFLYLPVGSGGYEEQSTDKEFPRIQD